MGRRLLYPEKMEGTFCEGTFARIDDILAEGEARTDFVRMAVEREIKLRKEYAKRRQLHMPSPGARLRQNHDRSSD